MPSAHLESFGHLIFRTNKTVISVSRTPDPSSKSKAKKKIASIQITAKGLRFKPKETFAGTEEELRIIETWLEEKARTGLSTVTSKDPIESNSEGASEACEAQALPASLEDDGEERNGNGEEKEKAEEKAKEDSLSPSLFECQLQTGLVIYDSDEEEEKINPNQLNFDFHGKDGEAKEADDKKAHANEAEISVVSASAEPDSQPESPVSESSPEKEKVFKNAENPIGETEASKKDNSPEDVATEESIPALEAEQVSAQIDESEKAVFVETEASMNPEPEKLEESETSNSEDRKTVKTEASENERVQSGPEEQNPNRSIIMPEEKESDAGSVPSGSLTENAEPSDSNEDLDVKKEEGGESCNDPVGEEPKFAPLKANQKILILCEGETEANYLNSVCKKLKISQHFEIRRGEKPQPEFLVEEAGKELLWSRFIGEGISEAWIVFDRDNHGEYVASIEMAGKIPGLYPIWSNPCIEAWFLMHVANPPYNFTRNWKQIAARQETVAEESEYYKKEQVTTFYEKTYSPEEVLKELRRIVPSYKKAGSNLGNLFLPKLPQAMANAGEIKNSPQDFGSRMPLLMERFFGIAGRSFDFFDITSVRNFEEESQTESRDLPKNWIKAGSGIEEVRDALYEDDPELPPFLSLPRLENLAANKKFADASYAIVNNLAALETDFRLWDESFEGYAVRKKLVGLVFLKELSKRFNSFLDNFTRFGINPSNISKKVDSPARQEEQNFLFRGMYLACLSLSKIEKADLEEFTPEERKRLMPALKALVSALRNHLMKIGKKRTLIFLGAESEEDYSDCEDDGWEDIPF